MGIPIPKFKFPNYLGNLELIYQNLN
ncbi:hypothetical protein LINPERPRIM_LOCUS12381 [Linum perenne]